MVFRGMKDSALALGLKSYLNDRFGDYGEIKDCEVDTEAGRLRLHARLLGERELVTAAIERYELEREGNEVYVVLKRFSSSREWLTRLLTRLLAGKRYRLPGPVAALL
jgi:hypothetical protein